MGIESQYIWMDGRMVPFAEANVHVLSHTLHYGLGVFEGIRAYEQDDGAGAVWKLDGHIRRLAESAKICRMAVPYTQAQISEACIATLQANRMTEAYIRPLVFLGAGRMGLGARDNPVHTVIAVWEWGKYLGDDGVKHGIRAQVSTFSRSHVNAAMQRAKVVGHYVNSILARYEAADNGFEEAIMLDPNGYVAEGTGENVFVIRDGVVMTPPVTNVLDGLTRQTVLDILAHEGIEVRQQMFGRDALYTADEVFVVGTAAEVTPVREVDRRLVGPPGPVTRRVQELYAAAIRGRVDWLASGLTRYTLPPA